MVKNQQFFVYKFNSDFLRYKDYKITCENINEARKNRWIVSLADSQALRTLRKLKYKQNPEAIKYNASQLNNLLLERKRAKRRTFTSENVSRIKYITSLIDSMLFVPEYVEIVITKKSQYIDLIKKGLIINGKKYVRFCCGAGQARSNTVIFIQQDYEIELKTYLQNGWNPNVKITDNKFNAYFALSTTATYQINDDDHPELIPKVLIIPDCITHMDKKVDWVEDNMEFDPDLPMHLQNKNKITTQIKNLEFNLFDGGGLIDISAAKKWADKLELEYVPAVFIIRNIYVKGCLFTVDFHKFAKEIARTNNIVDFFGNEQTILDKDIILTESMFKIAKAYTSMEQYQECCNEFGNHWGVARVSPKADTDWVTTNYQFVQTLDLKDSDVEAICETTKKWLLGIGGLDYRYSMLFLMGSLANRTCPKDVWNDISDNIVKALAINKEMINDDYIRQKLVANINKKINESYLGKLIVQGCFSTMIPDPYAMMEWAFSNGDISKVKGLLRDQEHYSQYWNARNVGTGVGCRSPLTWRSEVNKLNFIKNDKTEEWYKYLNSGIIYNIWGCDCMIHADSDYDGDIVFSTSDPTFLKCKYYDETNNLPITYEKKTVVKKIIKEKDLWKADIKSFDTKIGQITNYSTSMYDLIEKYRYNMSEYGRKCYNELLNRLKLTRYAQGNEIDKAKGVQSDPYPKHWIKKQKIESDDSEEIIQYKKFLNDICADKKPVFFKHRYNESKATDKNYKNVMDFYSAINFDNKFIEELNTGNDNEEQALTYYTDNTVLIDYHSAMNKVCHYMEDSLRMLKRPSNTCSYDTAKLLKTEKYCTTDENKLQKMRDFCNQYYDCKESARKGNKDESSDVEHVARLIREEAMEVFTDGEELADYVVQISYLDKYHQSKSFAWNVFGEYLLNNLSQNTLTSPQIPLRYDGGDIKYLFNDYQMFDINIIKDELE